MTDLQAAVGRVQLSKLPGFLAKRENIFQSYLSNSLNLFDEERASDIPARYRAVLKCNDPKKLIGALQDNGVHSINPVEPWELLDDSEKYPCALELAKSTVSLPIYPTLPEAAVVEISNIVKRIL